MMTSTQAIFVFKRNEPLSEEDLDRFADSCLEALNRDARFLAFGPVVSVDYSESAVEVSCTVCTESADEAEVSEKTEAIRKIALNGLAAAEYAVTERREFVPA